MSLMEAIDQTILSFKCIICHKHDLDKQDSPCYFCDDLKKVIKLREEVKEFGALKENELEVLQRRLWKNRNLDAHDIVVANELECQIDDDSDHVGN